MAAQRRGTQSQNGEIWSASAGLLRSAAGAVDEGRAVAELIAFGSYRTLDLSWFSFDCIVSGEALLELGVV